MNLDSVPAAAAVGNWTLFPNPSSWSNEAALLVWEQPAGVGFSRCKGGCPSAWNDTSSQLANLDILLAFLAATPDAAARPSIFISGESYGGVYVPLLAKALLDHGKQQQEHEHQLAKTSAAAAGGLSSSSTPPPPPPPPSPPLPPLRGIAVGNGCVGFGVSGGCGLDSLDNLVGVLEDRAPGVSRAALSAVRHACAGELDVGKGSADLSAGCQVAMRGLFEELGEYNQYHWGSPCGADGQGNWGTGSAYRCSNGVLQEYLAEPATQVALGVIASVSDPPRNWTQWDGDSPFYTITAADTLPTYRALLAANVSVLVYNGLRDTAVPNIGAEKWIPKVVVAAEEEVESDDAASGSSKPASAPATSWSPPLRRKWDAPSGPGGARAKAGEVTTYMGGLLTYATIEAAGHMVPADAPVQAQTMLEHWMAGLPLPEYRGQRCKRLWLGRGYGDFCE
eukprot:g2985.t1